MTRRASTATNKPRIQTTDAATPQTFTRFARHPLARAVRDSLRQLPSPGPARPISRLSLRGTVLDARVLASAGLGVALSVNTGAQAGDTPNPAILARPESGAGRQELVIIDAHVSSVETLERALRPGLEAMVLDPDRDGVEQITNILIDRPGIDALHLVSHGAPGRIRLGSTWLSADNAESYKERLTSWFLAQDGWHWDRPDLLIYGCDVGHGAAGSRFLDTLGAITGADVAASVDRTGASSQKGDWVFEVSSPAIETFHAFDHHRLASYPHTLATFTVTNLNDAGPGSLRAAIETANGTPGPDEIVFEGAATGGTLQLESSLTIEHDPAIDDSDSKAIDLVINGPGAKSLSIWGGEFSSIRISGNSRRALKRETKAIISGVSLTAQREAQSRTLAALQVDDQADLTLRDSIISGNDVGVRVLGGDPEYISFGFATIENSIIEGNDAGIVGDGVGYSMITIGDSLITNNSGDGICCTYADIERSSVFGNQRGVQAFGLDLRQSTIMDNEIGIQGSSVFIARSTVTGNNTGIRANLYPGSSYSGYHLSIRDSTITSNGAGVDINVNYSYCSIPPAYGSCEPDHFLENTIVAGNGQDCRGPIDSDGNNIVGDPTGCDVSLQDSDLTGDPGLGKLVDPGGPGQGRLPLLSISRAIDSGKSDTCSEIDQLNALRADGNGDGTVACDRGAVEFYPLIEDRVTLERVRSDFKPIPQPGAPAGTVTLKGTFTNSLDTTLYNPFFEVTKLKRSPVLLNAEGAPGQVGARLRPKVGRDQAVDPGESFTAVFKIGLEAAEPFRFDVGLHGDPRP